jgi:glycosyltransferase involved in cell wall biosynthesis
LLKKRELLRAQQEFKMNIKISIIMSCYNASRWLAEAIESVLFQTFKDFEFIIIDDGSTDETVDIIKRYAKTDSRIKIIKKTNTGLADSLNVGIDQAKGEWIARIDADDICMPNRFEKQINFLKINPSVVLLGCGCLEIEEDGNFIKKHKYPKRHRALVTNLEQLKAFFPHSSVLYRADIVRELGGYNPRCYMCEDRDLWLRLGEVGRIASFPELLIKLRKHKTSLSYNETNIYSIAVTVCYFLRKKGLPDPAAGYQEGWDFFIEWIKEKLDKRKVFEKAQAWQSIREEWYAERADPLMGRGIKLLGKLAESGVGFDVLKRKMFGSNLASNLANEWGKIQ